MNQKKKAWQRATGDAGGDGQRAGTAAERDTEAQLNAINKTFIQTINSVQGTLLSGF